LKSFSISAFEIKIVDQGVDCKDGQDIGLSLRPDSGLGA